MRTGLRGIFVALGAFAISGGAHAEWRCDCTSIVGSCSGSVTVAESFVEVTSNTEQCSRVDYFIDGRPFVALVVDGVDQQDWIARGESPAVIVQSCQVCTDNSGVSSTAEFGSSLEAEGAPTLLIEVEPDYPADASAAGVEGFVELGFTISLNGNVTNLEVIAAEPAGVFEEAALAAVSRWRYTRPGEASVSHSERVEFSLAEDILALRPASGLVPLTARQSEPEMNSCVREDTRYDFGAWIDISLFNACDAALVVFHCAAGAGSQSDLWICDSAGQTSGTVELTRAPNSEYWWLACAADDAGCVDQGTQWIRSMDRQVTTLDPQDRTRARLARAY